jgi:hypothetical protein
MWPLAFPTQTGLITKTFSLNFPPLNLSHYPCLQHQQAVPWEHTSCAGQGNRFTKTFISDSAQPPHSPKVQGRSRNQGTKYSPNRARTRYHHLDPYASMTAQERNRKAQHIYPLKLKQGTCKNQCTSTAVILTLCNKKARGGACL